MAQMARPVDDLSDGGWTNAADSNVNLYASVDELTHDDSDYIKSSVGPSDDTCKLSLSPLPTPGSGTVTLRIRGQWGLVDLGSPVAFVWSSFMGATSYTLELSADAITWPVGLSYPVGLVLTTTQIVPVGIWWSRVKAYTGASLVNTTAPQAFTV